nr:hemolysin family protein [uncultured Blautia sp.]
MDDGSRWPFLGLVVLLLLLVINGIFYGFAAAIRNLSENEIDKGAEEGDIKARRLRELLDDPVRYVNAIPLIVTASGIFTGVFLIPWLTRISHRYIDHLPALILLFALSVIILASLGILTFRRIGAYRSQKFAYRYVNFVYRMVLILYPLTFFITWISRLAASLFGVATGDRQDAVTEEEIISMVDEAHEQGVLQKDEAEMIQNIFAFSDTEAESVMTHRAGIVAFQLDDLLKSVVNAMLEQGNSRYPVYGEDLDDIRGMIHYKDALKFMTENSWAKYKPLKELPGLIRKATFVPETRNIGELFRTMQSRQVHMAIVVDEYGQTSGIVTMEDILEEIVGDILDEYDQDETRIRTQTDNSVLIDSLTSLDDVEEELGIAFGDVHMETLNGYLTEMLGHIPTEEDLGKEIVANGYRFKILSLGNRTLGRVRAEKINDKETEGESEKCQDIQNLQT